MLAGNAVLIGSYDYRLVALSVIIAICASYAALDLAARLTAAQGRSRIGWLVGGSSAMGLGIWSMHYIGMLAFSLPVAVSYDWPTVLISLLAAIGASAVALYVVSRKTMGFWRAGAGSVVMGTGIAAMHYIGMAAMRLTAMCYYDNFLVVLSVILAIVISFAALWLAFLGRAETTGLKHKIVSALVMGMAIPVMHYTGMAAASFTSSDVLPDLSHAVSISTLGIAGITATTIVVLGIVILTSMFNRRYSEQAVELDQAEQRYRMLFEKNPQPMWVFDLKSLAFLAVNQAAIRQYGYSEKEFLHMTIKDIRPPEEVPEVLATISEIAVGFERSGSWKHRRKDGTLIDVEISSHGFDWDGRPARLVLADDVTEKKRAEESIRHLAAIVESSEDAIIGKDLQGKILTWNQGAAKIYGYSTAEVLGKPIDMLTPPSRSGEISKILESIRGGREITHFETTRIRKDGEEIDIDLTVSPIKDSKGSIVGASAIARDISERKREEERVWRLAQALDGAGELIGTSDREGNVTFANQAFLQALGYGENELLGKPYGTAVLSPRNRHGLIEEINSAICSVGHWKGECLQRRKDGTELPVYLSLGQLKDSTGLVIGNIGIAQDITERKRAEENLRRLAAVVEVSDDAIIGQTPDGIILSWNHGAEKMFGYTAAEAVGRETSCLCPPDRPGEVRDVLQKVRQGETIRQFETMRLRKDGKQIPVAISISPVTDESGAIVAISSVARDISERKQMENQFRQAQKMEAVGRLSGGVAHDFNNLLGVIIGYSDVLDEKLGDNPSLRRNAEEIRKAARRAAELTRQLLAFSRQQVLKPKVLDLNMVVADIEKMLRRVIGEDVELTTKLGANLGRVKADQSQIEQVILNLAVNARDAMPLGGKLLIETENTEMDEDYVRRHPIGKPGAYVLLSVTDTGCGMDTETQAHIFEPFFTTKEVGKGTGLGLATVYGVVKQSNGYIWVYSEPGLGTTFKIYLPQVMDQVRPERTVPVQESRSARAETILLLEDEDSLRGLTHTFLTDAGYTVLEAADAARALDISRKHAGPIHLLLSDVVMPKMSGPEFAAILVPLRPETKVLFMSGYSTDAVMQRGMAQPNVRLLQKPFTKAALLQAVTEALQADAALSRN